jgi:hypothetical protein
VVQQVVSEEVKLGVRPVVSVVEVKLEVKPVVSVVEVKLEVERVRVVMGLLLGSSVRVLEVVESSLQTAPLQPTQATPRLLRPRVFG